MFFISIKREREREREREWTPKLREKRNQRLQSLFKGTTLISYIKIHTINSDNCMSQLNNYKFN